MPNLSQRMLEAVVYVLHIDSFRAILSDAYVQHGMTAEDADAYIERTERQVFLVTAAVCVVVMAVGYGLSRWFAGQLLGRVFWWLMFLAMIIAAMQLKKREGRLGFNLAALRGAIKKSRSDDL